jgi:transposase
VIVINNANSYYTQRKTIEEIFKEIKTKIEYLSAYSPDLNPIKTSFSSLKI